MSCSHSSVRIPTHAKHHHLLPRYSSLGAAGADVRAHLLSPIIIPPGTSALIPTGIKCEIPQGYEIQVRPRSGLALKHAITVLNAPGTIDSDYRGEIQIILINHGREDFIVEPDMRIAQLVVCPVSQVEFLEIDEKDLKESERGAQGFGHTGTH